MARSFLTLDEVLAIHDDQLRRYGGATGVRDLGLLESAVALPRATFDGNYLHETEFEVAAAYLFHIARNHPFVDGNKRTALAAALTFLWLQNIDVAVEPDTLYEMVVRVADGSAPKSEVAVFLETRSGPIEG